MFESKDTIRAALMGNSIAASTGQLVAPFVSKIAERLVDSDWPALQAAFRTWLAEENFDDKGQQKARLADLTRPLVSSFDPGSHECGKVGP